MMLGPPGASRKSPSEMEKQDACINKSRNGIQHTVSECNGTHWKGTLLCMTAVTLRQSICSLTFILKVLIGHLPENVTKRDCMHSASSSIKTSDGNYHKMLPRHGHYVGEWTPRMQWDISRGNFTLHKCDNQDTMDVLTNPWRGTWNTSQRKAQWETIACHIKNKELRCRLLDRIAVTKHTIQENRDYGCNGTYCKGTANYTRAPILTP